MKKYFKLIAVAMSLTMLLGLTACSSNEVAFIEDFDEEEELKKGYVDEDDAEELAETEAFDDEYSEEEDEEAVEEAVEEEGLYVFSDNVIYEKDGITVTVDSYDYENKYFNCSVDSTIDYREQFTCNLEVISFNGFNVTSMGSGNIKVSGTEKKEVQIYASNPYSMSGVNYSDICEAFGIDQDTFETVTFACNTYIEENDSDDPHYTYSADPVYKEFSVKNSKNVFNKAFGSVAGKGSLSVDNSYDRDYLEEYTSMDIGQSDLGFNVYAKIGDDGRLYVVTEGTLVDNVKKARWCNDFYDGSCKMPYMNLGVMPVMRAVLYIDDEKIDYYNFSLAEGSISPFVFDMQSFRDQHNIPDTQKLAVKVDYIGYTASESSETDQTITIDLGEY